MSRKKIIAVIAGGDSSEDVISYKSGAQVYGCLDRNLFEPYLVVLRGTSWRVNPSDAAPEGAVLPVDLNDFSFTDHTGRRIRFDYALIQIHGTPGENGILQGYFELMRIPYSTCTAEVSALTFNKSLCKLALQGKPGIHLAREILLHKGEPVPAAEVIIKELGLPFFIKPNASGSSFGVTKIKADDASSETIMQAIAAAFQESDAVMLEQFVDGREVSCGMMVAGGKEWILPVTELISEKEFFDFEAKYEGACREVTPALLPQEIVYALNKATATAYRTLGCRGMVRVDFIIDKTTGDPYFIEVNTTPGMSAASIVPQQWREAGLTMGEAFGMIINETSK